MPISRLCKFLQYVHHQRSGIRTPEQSTSQQSGISKRFCNHLMCSRERRTRINQLTPASLNGYQSTVSMDRERRTFFRCSKRSADDGSRPSRHCPVGAVPILDPSNSTTTTMLLNTLKEEDFRAEFGLTVPLD